MKTLQSFVFPDQRLETSSRLFLRSDIGSSHFDFPLTLAAGNVVGFNTYFNAFSVSKWLQHTGLRKVSLRLRTQGDLVAEVVHDLLNGRPEVLVNKQIGSDLPIDVELNVPSLDDLGEGSVYLRLTSTDRGSILHRAFWATSQSPARAIRLGIVITTFNRHDQVRESVKRLSDAFIESDHAEVRSVIVDNASNLGDLPEGPQIVVIPNANLGGCGGFTRGLMHFRHQGWASHILFMDDDVSFHPEIIRRTIQILAFANDDRLCLAGAMLRTDPPTEMFEAGARFFPKSLNPLKAVNGGRNLEDWQEVLEADDVVEMDYGAWWYFVFPSDITRDNPIPMFLHGDDVTWGLLHTGNHTISWSGIGLWHDEFELKNGPLTWFYEMRNFALASILAVPDFRWWHLLPRYLSACARSFLSFKYSSAELITLGLSEFLRGPEHWMEIDHAALHKSISKPNSEEIVTLDLEDSLIEQLPISFGGPKYLRVLLAAVTLGGNLLPSWARRSPAAAVPIQQRVLGAAPLRNAIVYRHRNKPLGFVAFRDRRRFFKCLASMVVTAARVPLNFRSVRKRYRRAYPEMTSDRYWNHAFGIKSATLTHPSGDAVASKDTGL